jgi:alpha-1,2-mannosyltransferase
MQVRAEKQADVERLTTAQPRRGWKLPTRIERLGIGLFFFCAIAFGGIVEMRSAFLNARRTDLDVYLRAAWAVRTGHDLYTIIDDRGWHYHYPPLFAIALIPLADPPPGQNRAGMMPFWLSVAVWYVLNLIFLGWAVNHLAAALEQCIATRYGGIPPPGSRSWWTLRILPILICIAPIGVALERGQADVLLLALLCAMIAAVMARRSFAAGMWLAGAICLKLFPAYLLIYPLWRRDWRMIASCGFGLMLGLVLIPAAYFGPAQALSYAREWNQVLIQPALFNGANQSRTGELLDINGTDNQSFVAMFHRWRNFDETVTVARRFRSRPLESWARPAHWCAALLLTALTLLAAGLRPTGESALREELVIGSLAILMVLSSPVSHVHYFTLMVPLAMGLLIFGRGGAVYPGWKWIWLFAAVGLSAAVALLPGLGALRDLCVGSFGALALWGAGLVVIGRLPEPRIVHQLNSGRLKPEPAVRVGEQL